MRRPGSAGRGAFPFPPPILELGMELMISEETLRQMPAEDRAALARSLATVNADLPSLSAAEHRRRRLVLMLTVASAVLIPWIVLLALTLPRHYVAGHWRLTWVGFDIILLAALAATAWFAWRRRQAVVITAFVTATLLTCDAWFDVTTASGQKTPWKRSPRPCSSNCPWPRCCTGWPTACCGRRCAGPAAWTATRTSRSGWPPSR